jgi:hypothetical protein
MCTALACTALAQTPVAPTDLPTQPNRGDNDGGYNIVQSFEVGYRWAATGGDTDMYRSTVNYTDGLRLLSGLLTIRSREGHGKWFDSIYINTQGLGNDPYQSASLRIEQNKWYRYDMTWRSDAFFDPALTTAYGEHQINTVRHLQDHDLTLFQQSWFKALLGYSRDTQSGPALSTIQLFDPTGNEFPLLSNIRRQQNEYRLGANMKLAGFRVNVLHAWQDYKEDTVQFLNATSLGNSLNNITQLDSFLSTQPNHGTSPYWRVGLFREGKKYWSVNGLFSYVAGRRAFILDEGASGLNRIGSPTELLSQAFGNANRPTATGNLTFSVFPTSKITFTNQTSVYNIRMSGSNYFEQYFDGSLLTPMVAFNYLGILTIANATTVEVHIKPWITVHGGYTYSDRRIGSEQMQTAVTALAPPFPTIEQTNRQNVGTFGVRLRAWKALTVNLDAEIGEASMPIYPISDKNYQALHGRVEYRRKLWRAMANARSDYNNNSISLTSFASHTRQYGVDASWTPSDRFSIDASYSRLHSDSLGGISYFVGAGPAVLDHSYYVSNIHAATLMARFAVAKRADVSLGYSHVQDVGDGRATAVGNLLDVAPSTAATAFAAAQTFPLRFLSPQAKLSIHITPKVRWNAGYQYYGYRENFSALQNYRAHTGYTSVSWSF